MERRQERLEKSDKSILCPLLKKSEESMSLSIIEESLYMEVSVSIKVSIAAKGDCGKQEMESKKYRGCWFKGVGLGGCLGEGKREGGEGGGRGSEGRKRGGRREGRRRDMEGIEGGLRGRIGREE